GVELPAAGAITALLLTPAEWEVACQVGTYRILMLLAKASQDSSVPVWSDRQRPDVLGLGDLGQSILGRLPTTKGVGAVAWATPALPTAPTGEITLQVPASQRAAV